MVDAALTGRPRKARLRSRPDDAGILNGFAASLDPLLANAELGKPNRRGDPAAVVGGIGLEPTAFAMSTQRSNQLS